MKKRNIERWLHGKGCFQLLFFLFCLLLAFFLLNGSWLKPSFVALKGKDKYMTPVVSLECWHIAKNADAAQHLSRLQVILYPKREMIIIIKGRPKKKKRKRKKKFPSAKHNFMVDIDH